MREKYGAPSWSLNRYAARAAPVVSALPVSSRRVLTPSNGVAVKKILELLLCILHPVAVVLIWINLLMRDDIGLIPKLTWAIASIVPLVPFVYVLTGNDFI